MAAHGTRRTAGDPLKAPVRERRIRELLQAQEFVDLGTLCQELGTSESSVRRDLAALELTGILRRVHGGAVSATPRGDSYDFSRQTERAVEEKRRIGRRAARLVEDGSTLILDGGTTVAALARELLDRSLHVITNAVPIAQILSASRSVEVTLTGGVLYPRLGVLLGPFCEEMLGKVTADAAIMGVGGVTDQGLSNNDTLLVGTEKRMIAAARRVIILADHGKFGRPAMVPLASLSEVDVMVSDSELDERHRRLVKRHGIELELA
jgi:DeoR/GlpR family transcriptional regulator of sugar metabolism